MGEARYFIGLDGGATRCRARLLDFQGRRLAEQIGPAANIYVDFDQSLANAVILIPEIQRLDVLHAIDLAQRLVEMLLMLGAKWSDAALFDLAMTLYCLEGASWQYARTCGAANATLSERLLTCALTLVEPAMRGDPEPAGHGMDRDRLLAEYALTRA